MTAVTLTSELEAVNSILEAADEAPVASLALSGLYPLDKAKALLSETSRAVQSVGWEFNTEREYPLTRAGNGEISVPSNVLKVDADASPKARPTQRGSRLYDLLGHTYTFSEDVTATVVFLLPWDELPQAARTYITIRAARTMQARSSVPESSFRYSHADEEHALIALSLHESDVGDNNMLDGWNGKFMEWGL